MTHIDPKSEASEKQPQGKTLEAIRQQHAKAYAPWDKEQDDALLASYREMQRPTSGMSESAWIAKMAKEFGRQTGGIRARIQKLIEGPAPVYKTPRATNAPKKASESTRRMAAHAPAAASRPIVFSAEAHEALAVMEEGDSSLFLTGRAGTGKSTLLKYFREKTKKNVVVLAPTGVAALNVGGQTIHSFFGFRPGTTLQDIKKRFDKKAALFAKLDMIIIDEVSMVRADLMDCIDKFLRLNGKFQSAPFGGIQMIFIGDLYQLPPVVPPAEKEFLAQYDSPYFFDSAAFKEADPGYIELSEVYRQHDADFIEVLNAIRIAQVDDSHLALINQRATTELFGDDEPYIYLTTRTDMADRVNETKLREIDAPVRVFSGTISGNFKESMLPTAPELRLKEGAQVMLLNNDQQGRWVNGDIGVVERFEKGGDAVGAVVVRLESGETVFVEPFSWELVKFAYDKKKEQVVSEVDGSFTQYPLRLAWAVTIHKGQGKTFDRVVVDFGHGTFAHGQAYVALSRCRSLSGLILKSPLEKRHIFIDPRVSRFIAQFAERTRPA
jgi:ATP-dependent exoDNAse (exonuclease V) alpha subunit